jgi:hypothetical protein
MGFVICVCVCIVIRVVLVFTCFVVLCVLIVIVLCYFHCFVCTSVRLLPPGENPIAVSNNNNNNNNNNNLLSVPKRLPQKLCCLAGPNETGSCLCVVS